MITINDVRPETLALLEAGLRALAEDLGDPYRATSGSLSTALFSDKPSCHGLIAARKGDVLGVSLFSPIFSTMFGGAGIYVSDLWVAPLARGGGLAPRLLRQTIQRGQSLWAAEYLRLVSYDDNPRAGAFYQKLGFQPHQGETTLRLSGTAFDDFART